MLWALSWEPKQSQKAFFQGYAVITYQSWVLHPRSLGTIPMFLVLFHVLVDLTQHLTTYVHTLRLHACSTHKRQVSCFFTVYFCQRTSLETQDTQAMTSTAGEFSVFKVQGHTSRLWDRHPKPSEHSNGQRGSRLTEDEALWTHE